MDCHIDTPPLLRWGNVAIHFNMHHGHLDRPILAGTAKGGMDKWLCLLSETIKENSIYDKRR